MMISYFSFVFAFLLLVGGRGGIDLLDTLPTASYWQAKNVTPTAEQLTRDAGPDGPPADVTALLKDLASTDFATRDKAKKGLEAAGPAIIPQLKPAITSADLDVAAVAGELVKRFNENGQERAVRRLMAIRTLGERKEKNALPLLKGLVNSQELFVSDYALRAVAQIEGNRLEAVDHKADMAKDLSLLPKDVSIVGQMVAEAAPGQAPLTLEVVVDRMLANPGALGMGGFGGPAGGAKPDRQRLLANATRQMLKVLERVGNMRLEGVTVGVSDNAGDTAGWGIIVFRGTYNARAFVDALRAMDPGEAGRGAATQGAGNDQIAAIPHYVPDDDATFLFPSDHQMIAVLSGAERDRAAALGAVAAALKAGKGTLDQNADMATRLKTLNVAGPVWAVVRPTEEMKKAKMLEAFDTVTLDAAGTAEGLTFTFKGEGADPEKVAASAAELSNDVKQAQQAMAAQAGQMPVLQPVVDFMNSLKVVAEAKTATFTGAIKPTVVDAVLAGVGPFVLGSLLEEPQVIEGIGQDTGLPAP
jgi:hypothetical protein